MLTEQELVNFYKNPLIRDRIVEYLGGSSVNTATALYLTRCDLQNYDCMRIHPVHELPVYLDNGWDICRSLWDHRYLLAHLDIEYVNFDFLAEPFLDRLRVFEIQNRLVLETKNLLEEMGIKSLHLLTGRGHHFIWKISRQSKAFGELVTLAQLPPHLISRYKHPHPPLGEIISRDLGTAYAALGMIMEYLSYLIKTVSAPHCRIPVQITSVIAGPAERGREIVSIDISEYGDPLHTRMIRIPFTPYLKPRMQYIGIEGEDLKKIPAMFMIPCESLDIPNAVTLMQDPGEVIDLSGKISVEIPDRSREMEELIRIYRKSDVRRFHDWFYSQEQQDPSQWPCTYDMTPLDILPVCVREALIRPNNLLLKPGEIDLVVKSFLALGWHPRHIAGLIRSRYERDFGWGNYWLTYDAATRADFYTRIFSGLFVLGLDDLIDYNCISTREKGLCLNPPEKCRIDEFRESLLKRRQNDRLACGPFNRLFL